MKTTEVTVNPITHWGRRALLTGLALLLPATMLSIPAQTAQASDPTETTLSDPGAKGKLVRTFSGTVIGTGAADASLPCQTFYCDTHAVHMSVPANYWTTHSGGVKLTVDWDQSAGDFDIYVLDEAGATIGSAANSGAGPEIVDLGKLAAGDYTVEVRSWVAPPATNYTGTFVFTSTKLPKAMMFNETHDSLIKELTQTYPLRVVFVGRKPSKEEIAELRHWIPTNYQPTVANKSASPGDLNAGAGLLNWNKAHYRPGESPYFIGTRFNYKLQVLVASDAYAKALFNVAKKNTAQDQTYHDGALTDGGQSTANLVKYDETYGDFRVIAKGDPTFKVIDPTVHDLVDAFAVEDWIFNSRDDKRWDCAFKNTATGKCVSAKVIQNTRGYHDPYYDKFGLNLDKMPQGVNKGTTTFFLDTFTPDYAADYFRPGSYHVWGTDKVIDGQIVAKPATKGGSWRITDPDTGNWSGVDNARTWGGRYRFHFFDLGAAPNDYESASWLGKERTMSSDLPYGDPPVWQYDQDPSWQQSGEECATIPELNYTGGTPCRMMPRLARDVAYQLFFRSTAGYLYRPIPRGDVNWLAVSNWTDFYSRPQPDPVTGTLTNAPWYGTWWTNMQKLYKIGHIKNGVKQDDTLRWLSSALPYTRWVGRRGESIPLYDPTSNRPTGEFLNVAPKYEDLPAPEYHVSQSASGMDIAPEPLYDGQHVKVKYQGKTVDLTAVQIAIEKAKASGLLGATYDDSVNPDLFRDFVDANRPGIADRVTGINTIPSINIVFEKVYTWALPAIVGGIAESTADGEAWGVLNNVNDRFKACSANYPSGQAEGAPQSLIDQCLPTQETGTGFSYTIEHEAAHNLGLSHPHDGSYGVDRCPAGDPNEGQWKCYWQGLGWLMDVSAAPTTYAMAYRPYGVEDQDNLQRGHVVEYLVAAQDALREALVREAKAGRTTPSAGWDKRYEQYKKWKTVAVKLFKRGDYLHAEYAARNSAIASRGFAQTQARVIAPRLLQAGQVYYFKVHPQTTRGLD
jgi:hypothetical protein